MRVHLKPVGLFSPAMTRISRALTATKPEEVELTDDPRRADLRVMYVISADAEQIAAEQIARGRRYAVVQCCLKTAGVPAMGWGEFWRRAAAVWSYYQLDVPGQILAPLGVDDAFKARRQTFGQQGIVTTGTTHGDCAEALAEVWEAAAKLGMGPVTHVGPSDVRGFGRVPRNVTAVQALTDSKLAAVYADAQWVVALRHVEGFELPAAEGLVCGARPILFDQPDLRRWYGAQAEYVPDVHGQALVDALVERLVKRRPVTPEERRAAVEAFDWKIGCGEFWKRAIGSQEETA